MILCPRSAARLAVLALACALLPSAAGASLTSLGEVKDSIPELTTALPRELPGPCEGELCGEREGVWVETRVRGFELDLSCRLGGEQGLSCAPRRVYGVEYGERASGRSVFTGHYFDTETQLYYAKSRYFDPQLGRFLSQDSYLGELTEPPSLHRYLYAADNPTRYIDPDGHDFIDPLERGCLPGQGCVPIGSKVTPMDVSDAGAWALGSLYESGRALLLSARAAFKAATGDPALGTAVYNFLSHPIDSTKAYVAERKAAYSHGVDEYADSKSAFDRGRIATRTVTPEAGVVAGGVTFGARRLMSRAAVASETVAEVQGVVEGTPSAVRTVEDFLPEAQRRTAAMKAKWGGSEVFAMDKEGLGPKKGESVYVHLDEAGRETYVGITDDLPRRAGQHRLDPTKTGTRMAPRTDPLTHDQARTIEAMRIRERLAEARAKGLIDGTEPVQEQLQKAGLENKNRGRDPNRWLDLDPDDYLRDVGGTELDIRTPVKRKP